MERRAELEGMLRDVQEIKSEHYIGTAEALDILRSVRTVYTTPHMVACGINSRLGQGSGGYRATPERLSGIEDATDYLISGATSTDLSHFEDHLFDEIGYGESTLSKMLIAGPFPHGLPGNFTEGGVFGICLDENSRLRHIPHYIHFIPSKNAVRNLTRMWLPLFRRVNDEGGVNNDEELGRALTSFIGLSMNIAGLHEEAPRAYAVLSNRLESIDWNRYLSKAAHYKRERHAIECITTENIKPENIAQRVITDGVDHRLEYRRQVLCRFIEGYMLDARTCGRHPPSYDDLVRSADSLVSTIGAGRRAKRARFIRHVIGADKNFVERFLGS